jgi:hypothetical protein
LVTPNADFTPNSNPTPNPNLVFGVMGFGVTGGHDVSKAGRKLRKRKNREHSDFAFLNDNDISGVDYD